MPQINTQLHSHPTQAPLLSLQAIQGQAIDRHLLGLKLQAIEEQVSLPEIFTDPSYAAAMHFKMSTSQVGSNTCHVLVEYKHTVLPVKTSSVHFVF